MKGGDGSTVATASSSSTPSNLPGNTYDDCFASNVVIRFIPRNAKIHRGNHPFFTGKVKLVRSHSLHDRGSARSYTRNSTRYSRLLGNHPFPLHSNMV